MTPSKRRTYLLAIAVGCVALVVDKCVLTDGITEPESLEAAAVAGVAAHTPPASRATTTPSEIPDLRFPRNIPKLPQGAAVRDVFLRPSATLAADTDPTADNGDSPDAKPTALRKAAFQQAHRLNGVFIDERLRIAIVDGQIRRLGETLSGCELVELTGNEARFLCADGDSVLTVFGPGSLPPR